MKPYQIAFLIKTGRAEEAYKALVIEKIRTRYTLNDELAMLRQGDEKPEEYAEYNAYVERCKEEARAEINAEHTVPVNRVYVPAEPVAEPTETPTDGDEAKTEQTPNEGEATATEGETEPDGSTEG